MRTHIGVRSLGCAVVTVLLCLWLATVLGESSNQRSTIRWIARQTSPYDIGGSTLNTDETVTTTTPLPELELDDCSAITNCEECYKATGCHFCENDRKCHRYGSIHGCIYGLSCEDQYKCLREKPEFRGYKSHSTWTYIALVLGAIGSGALIIAILYAGFFCCRSKSDERTDYIEARTLGSIQRLDSNSNGDEAVRSQGIIIASERAASPSSHVTEYQLLDDGELDDIIASADGAASAHSGAQDNENETRILPSRSFNRFVWCSLCPSICRGRGHSSNVPASLSHQHDNSSDFAISSSQASASSSSWCSRNLCKMTRICVFSYIVYLTTLMVIVASILLCLFYPNVPSYSLCNTKIEWASILSYVTNMNDAAHVRLQLSIHNPNRFAVVVNRLKCRVLYAKNNQEVGYAEFPSMLTSSHAQGDVIEPIPEISLANLTIDRSENTLPPSLMHDALNEFEGVHGDDHKKHELLKLPPGSVTDVTFVALINPSLRTATNMGIDYARGQLLVNVHVVADTSIEVWDRQLTRVNGSYIVSDVNLATPPDRYLCACP